ncbi:MAG: helix-turn-helix transcriptional regulator [Paracoccaceae bacterium]
MTIFRLRRRTIWLLAILFVVQLICAVFFVSEFVTEVFGLRDWALPFEWREVLQVLASLGLVFGSITGGLLLRHVLRQMRRVQHQLQAASGEFQLMLDDCLTRWALTPAERDVAIFAIKGMSNAEIAALRNKSEATIKAQLNAVFRKAGVNGRAQLISYFIEVLMNTKPGTLRAAAADLST